MAGVSGSTGLTAPVAVATGLTGLTAPVSGLTGLSQVYLADWMVSSQSWSTGTTGFSCLTGVAGVGERSVVSAGGAVPASQQPIFSLFELLPPSMPAELVSGYLGTADREKEASNDRSRG